mmetsp:Transcript_18363/g.47024  ORF Transcript_18363/g.47024 Transcript_18363/m.47024 type:complete len:203 (-) Transcript_18363:35-643(-)
MNSTSSMSGWSRSASSIPSLIFSGPVYSATTLPRPSMVSAEAIRTEPPKPVIAGMISWMASIATPTSSSVGPVPTSTTSARSGHCSFRTRSMPIFIVVVDDGQEPQAPCNWRLTILASASTPTTATLPPSLIRYGRTSSSTVSTLSTVRSMAAFAPPLPVGAAPLESKGELIDSAARRTPTRLYAGSAPHGGAHGAVKLKAR